VITRRRTGPADETGLRAIPPIPHTGEETFVRAHDIVTVEAPASLETAMPRYAVAASVLL
jgi:hypothetical protein